MRRRVSSNGRGHFVFWFISQEGFHSGLSHLLVAFIVNFPQGKGHKKWAIIQCCTFPVNVDHLQFLPAFGHSNDLRYCFFRSCLHESYLFVVHSNDIQINAHYNEDSDRFYEEKIKQIKGMGNLKYSDQVRLLQGSDFWRDGENSKKWKWDMYVLHQSYTEIVYLSFNMSLMYVGLYIKYGSMLDIC